MQQDQRPDRLELVEERLEVGKREVERGRVVVRTRVAEIGRTSLTFEHEVVAPGGEIAATSRAVLVAWDSDTRAARAISDAERAKLG